MSSSAPSIVISASGLGKAYREYAHSIARLGTVLFGGSGGSLNWIFRGVDFEVAAGEAVAIIGKNGAGKSTLLRLISGMQSPTEGSVKLGGSVSSILELGIGLHPEFTGEENARQLGLIQGIAAQQLEAIIPQISSFSELGDYFYRPIRTYSSGMQMRLAFSVATVRRPDVLIVDEAMAVGDAYFQHKCFERIRSMRDQGTAILLVSHDPTAVRSICTRAILLHEGRCVDDGSAADVLDHYNALLAPDVQQVHRGRPGQRSGNGRVVIESVSLSQFGAVTSTPISGGPVTLDVGLRADDSVDDLAIGILFRDRIGNDVFGTNTAHHDLRLVAHRGERLHVQWCIDRFNLGPGHYSLTLAAHAGLSHQAGNFDWWNRALTFQVTPADGPLQIGAAAMVVKVDCFRHKDGHRP